MLNGWPSRDPQNFSHFRPSDPSNPSMLSSVFKVPAPAETQKQICGGTLNRNKMAAATYCPTHHRTLPPPDQVITSESMNILLRKMYQTEEKPTAKRGPPENLVPEQGCKQPRPLPTTSDSDQSS